MAQTTNFDAIVAGPNLKEQAKNNEQFKYYANLIVRYEGDAAMATADVRRALQQPRSCHLSRQQ
jgi:hypothetical protein